MKNKKRLMISEVANSARSSYNISISETRSAIDTSRTGNFADIAEFAQLMLVDESYAAARKQRIQALLQQKLDVVLRKDVNDPVAIEVRDALKTYLPQMIRQEELEKFVGNYYDTSVTVANVFVEVDIEAKMKIPTLRTLSTRNVSYELTTEKWKFNSKTGEIDIVPGDGTWVFLAQWSYGDVAGLASQCALNYVNKKYALESWPDLIDGVAWPILAFKSPDADAKNEEALKAATDAYFNARGQRTMMMFGNQSVEAINTNVNSNKMYEDLCRYVDTKYQISWLGGNLTSEITDGGSYAAASVQNSRLNGLLRADAKALESVFNEQLVPLFVKWNDYELERKNYPQIQFEFIDTEDTEMLGKSLTTFAGFLTQIMGTEFEVTNIVELGKKFGIDLKKKALPTSPTPQSTTEIQDACGTTKRRKKV